MNEVDLKFIDNSDKNNLRNRFKEILKSAEELDILVGYFFTSGFYELKNDFDNVKKIRILIGLSTDEHTYNVVQRSLVESQESKTRAQDVFSQSVEKEYSESQDNYDVEKGTKLFIKFLKEGKIEFRCYPDRNLHAKVYITRFDKTQFSKGCVITGSSNFSRSGLVSNREFNVMLQEHGDIKYATKTFNKLWDKSVDLSESYIESIKKKTWVSDEVSPKERDLLEDSFVPKFVNLN